MTIVFEALYAREGDCLLLHHGTPGHRRHVLVDGGMGPTFVESLKPRLGALAEEDGIEEGKSLPIELVVVTHIDEDHLDGIVKMAEHLAGLHEGKPWDIKNLWFNSFDDVVGNDRCARIASFAPSGPPEAVAWMAGVDKGQALRKLAKKLFISSNQPHDKFPAGLVVRPSTGPVTVAFGDLKLQVLGPDADALGRQETEWDDYVAEHAPAAGSPAAATRQDNSVPNLSSIVLFAEAEGKRLLLTGDANTDEILAGLRAAGLVREGVPCEVDVLKLPHHGSCRNSKAALYENVRARHYVISANGLHDNPDLETLKMLWDARKGEKGWDIHVTFRRNEFELIEGTGKAERKRRDVLEGVQRWFDDKPVKVVYRKPSALGITIEL